MTWAVLATGESMSQAVANRVRHLPCVVASDAFRLAPWAKALVACDGKWWRANPDALKFAGEKYCANGVQEVRRYPARPGIGTSTNSGLLALDCAIASGAKRVLLLGIDMRGTHYFGPHKTLANTTPGRFMVFLEQFKRYAANCVVPVFNCSLNSGLEVFPKMSLDEALETELETT